MRDQIRKAGFAKIFTGVTWLFLLAVLPVGSPAVAQTAPVFQIVKVQSTMKFFVDASVSVSGAFKDWDASLLFASNNAATGVLDLKIQAASVDTGSGLKDRKLKGEDFFDVENHPLITFRSNRITQTGPGTFDMVGDFTIRGVTKPEKLALTVSGAGSGLGTIKGTMTFNRKDYGINGSIPLVHIADRVDVTVNLQVRRVSGPPLVFKKE